MEKEQEKKSEKNISIESLRKVGRERWESRDEGSGRGPFEGVGHMDMVCWEGKCLEK